MPLSRISLLVAVALATGCASGPPSNPAIVVPYEGGLNVASAFSDTEQGAMRKALRGAQMTCDERRGQLAVLKTTTAYRGVVGREMQQTVEQIEQIIVASGGDAGTVPDLSRDDDYKVSIEFRCDSSR